MKEVEMIEIKVQQNAFAAALNVVTKASKTSALLPTFELVRLEASSNRLQLTCFNGEFAARGVIPAQCLDAGTANVNASTLREIVQTMDGEINLKISEDELRIECGANRAYLRLNAETLPVIESDNVNDAFVLKGRQIRKLADVALFASTGETRPSLQGIHLTLANDETNQPVLQAQAADGFCLGRAQINGDSSKGLTVTPNDQPRIISGLPSAFLRIFANMIEDDDEVQLQFQAKGKQALLQISGEGREFIFAAALLQDAFPASSVDDLLAKTAEAPGTEIHLQGNPLERVIRQVNAMGTKSMFLKVSQKLIRVASESTQFGQAKNVLPGEITGGDAQVWINTDLLSKVVKACSKEVTVKIGKPTDPVLFTSGDLTALVMPLANNDDPFKGESGAVALTLADAALVSA